MWCSHYFNLGVAKREAAPIGRFERSVIRRRYKVECFIAEANVGGREGGRERAAVLRGVCTPCRLRLPGGQKRSLAKPVQRKPGSSSCQGSTVCFTGATVEGQPGAADQVSLRCLASHCPTLSS